MIHPTAVVDRHAELDSTVEVAPFAVIGPKVKIGPRTRIGPHTVVEGDTTIYNADPGARFARADGSTREEAEAHALEKATRYLAQTRRFSPGSGLPVVPATRCARPVRAAWSEPSPQPLHSTSNL